MPIVKMVETGEQVLAAIELKDLEAIQQAAKSFSQAVGDAWQAYQEGEISTQVRGQALPRTMYQFATVELPLAIADPQRWPAIAREMRTFLNMVNIVISKADE